MLGVGVVVLSAAVVGMAAYSLFSLYRTFELRRAKAELEEFHELVRKLVEDERTPAAVIKFLIRLNGCAGQPSFARWVAKAAFSGQLFKEGDIVTNDQRQLVAGRKALPADLARTFSRAIMLCIMSAVHASSWGIVLQAMIITGFVVERAGAHGRHASLASDMKAGASVVKSPLRPEQAEQIAFGFAGEPAFCKAA